MPPSIGEASPRPNRPSSVLMRTKAARGPGSPGSPHSN